MMTKNERDNLKVIGNLLQIMFDEGLPFKWAVEYEAALQAYINMNGPTPDVRPRPWAKNGSLIK
tara:strand:- start:583 stop:774 length:192 start_codon:yes stop_codon:yes gene_type:complete